jgi:hypothetical protein
MIDGESYQNNTSLPSINAFEIVSFSFEIRLSMCLQEAIKIISIAVLMIVGVHRRLLQLVISSLELPTASRPITIASLFSARDFRDLSFFVASSTIATIEANFDPRLSADQIMKKV